MIYIEMTDVCHSVIQHSTWFCAKGKMRNKITVSNRGPITQLPDLPLCKISTLFCFALLLFIFHPFFH